MGAIGARVLVSVGLLIVGSTMVGCGHKPDGASPADATPSSHEKALSEGEAKPVKGLWWRQPVVEADTQKLVLLLLPQVTQNGDKLALAMANGYKYEATLKGVPESLEKVTRYEFDVVAAQDGADRRIDAKAMEARDQSIREFKTAAAQLGLDSYEVSQMLFVPNYERTFYPKRGAYGEEGYHAKYKFAEFNMQVGTAIASLVEEVQKLTGLPRDDAEYLVMVKLLELYNWGRDMRLVKDAVSLNTAFLATVELGKAGKAKFHGLTVEEYERARAVIVNACREEQQRAVEEKEAPK